MRIQQGVEINFSGDLRPILGIDIVYIKLFEAEKVPKGVGVSSDPVVQIIYRSGTVYSPLSSREYTKTT